MKYILISLLLLFLSSCVDVNGEYCSDPGEYNKNTAQSYYDSFGVYKVRMTPEEARKMFGCNYRRGDSIYSYSTFWGKKYILVRYGKAVTYIEEK